MSKDKLRVLVPHVLDYFQSSSSYLLVPEMKDTWTFTFNFDAVSSHCSKNLKLLVWSHMSLKSLISETQATNSIHIQERELNWEIFSIQGRKVLNAKNQNSISVHIPFYCSNCAPVPTLNLGLEDDIIFFLRSQKMFVKIVDLVGFSTILHNSFSLQTLQTILPLIRENITWCAKALFSGSQSYHHFSLP